jgi:hypothetical protein
MAYRKPPKVFHPAAQFKISQQMEEQIIQRLRHGLVQYYIHHYRPEEASGHIE